MEKIILDNLNSYGYTYDDINGTLNNIKSLQQLSSDILNIISSRNLNINKYKSEIELHKAVKLTQEEQLNYPFKIEEPFIFKISDIINRRNSISDKVFQNIKYYNFNNSEFYKNKLNDMFKFYDYYFFNNMISYALSKSNGNISFEFSNKLTSTGGTCRRNGICTYEIKISSDRINKLKHENLSKITINGLVPTDMVNGLQLIFEHELIHAVLSIFTDNINGHNNLFKTIVFNLFGHTQITHGITDRVLFSSHSVLSRDLTKFDFSINENIYFNSPKYGNVYGKVLKLNPKLALVDTPQGPYKVRYSALKKV